MQIQLSLSSPSLAKPINPLCKPAFSIRRNRHLVVSAAASPSQLRPAAEAATMYELLSVEETARPEEIKAAFKRQARQWHPDACPSSGDRRFFAQQFMRAREAYVVLSDPMRREGYDCALRASVTPGCWAATLGGGIIFRKSGDSARARGQGGSGDWASQLEGLKRRRASGTPTTWGSRIRSANQSGPSE